MGKGWEDTGSTQSLYRPTPPQVLLPIAGNQNTPPPSPKEKRDRVYRKLNQKGSDPGVVGRVEERWRRAAMQTRDEDSLASGRCVPRLQDHWLSLYPPRRDCKSFLWRNWIAPPHPLPPPKTYADWLLWALQWDIQVHSWSPYSEAYPLMSPSHAHKAFHQFSFKALLLHMYEPNAIYLRQASNIKQVGKKDGRK